MNDERKWKKIESSVIEDFPQVEIQVYDHESIGYNAEFKPTPYVLMIVAATENDTLASLPNTLISLVGQEDVVQLAGKDPNLMLILDQTRLQPEQFFRTTDQEGDPVPFEKNIEVLLTAWQVFVDIYKPHSFVLLFSNDPQKVKMNAALMKVTWNLKGPLLTQEEMDTIEGGPKSPLSTNKHSLSTLKALANGRNVAPKILFAGTEVKVQETFRKWLDKGVPLPDLSSLPKE